MIYVKNVPKWMIYAYKMFQNVWFIHKKYTKMYDLSIKNISKCIIYSKKNTKMYDLYIKK